MSVSLGEGRGLSPGPSWRGNWCSVGQEMKRVRVDKIRGAARARQHRDMYLWTHGLCLTCPSPSSSHLSASQCTRSRA